MGWGNAGWVGDGGWYLNKAAGGGGLPIYTYLSSSGQLVSASNTATFSSFNIGTAASNRVIAIAILTAINTPVVTAVSVGGNAATQATGAAGQTVSTASDLWYIALTTGTSANIVVTYGGSGTFNCIIGVAAIGTNTPTPGTGSNGQTGFAGTDATTVTIPGSGVAFSGIFLQNANTSTFSNMTIDDSPTLASAQQYFGHQTTTGTNTATFSASDRASMVTVPWGP